MAAPRSAPLPADRVKSHLLAVVSVATTPDAERPALAARRKRSLDLLKQSDDLLELGPTAGRDVRLEGSASAPLGEACLSPSALVQSAEAGMDEDEWQAVVRSHKRCGSMDPPSKPTKSAILYPDASQGPYDGSSSSDDNEAVGVGRGLNLHPSGLPLFSPRHARGAAVDTGSDSFCSEPPQAEGEMMETLKRIVPQPSVRRFRHRASLRFFAGSHPS